MYKALILAGACVLALPAPAMAKVETLDPSAPGSPLTLAQEIVNDPGTLAGASLPERAYGGAGSISPIGRGNRVLDPEPKVLTGFPTFGDTYGIMSSGDVNNVASKLTNDSTGTSTSFTTQFPPAPPPDRGSGARDWTVLKIDVNVPANTNCLALDYRFLSEEFPEYVGKSFNDAFIAEVDATTWSVGPGGALTRPNDFAVKADGVPVSVNGVGAGQMFATESAGTYFDAATGLVTTKTAIKAGPHSIYLSIFDASDKALDSAVFLDNLRFVSEGSKTCHALGGADLVPTNVFSIVGSSVKFTNKGNSVQVTINVPDTGNVAVNSPPVKASSAAVAADRAAAAKKKKKKKKKAKKKSLVTPATARALTAGPVTLTLNLNKTGKSLRKKRKLTVPLAISYTPDGGTASTQTLKVKFKKAKAKKKKAKKRKKH